MIKELKIDKISVKELHDVAVKSLIDKYKQDAKDMFSDNPQLLMQAFKEIPKGEQLEKEVQDWLSQLDGVVSLVYYALNKHNPDATDDEIKEYIESLDTDALIEHGVKVCGSEEVDAKKK